MSWPYNGPPGKPGMFNSWAEACVMLGAGLFFCFVVAAAVYELVTL